MRETAVTGVLTYQKAVWLQAILGAAQDSKQVRRWIDGYVTIGHVERVCAADGGYLGTEDDILSGFLYVRSATATGAVHIWPIRELIAEMDSDTWSDRAAFVVM